MNSVFPPPQTHRLSEGPLVVACAQTYYPAGMDVVDKGMHIDGQRRSHWASSHVGPNWIFPRGRCSLKDMESGLRIGAKVPRSSDAHGAFDYCIRLTAGKDRLYRHKRAGKSLPDGPLA